METEKETTGNVPPASPIPWSYSQETSYIYDANGDLVLNCLGAVAGDGDIIGKILAAVNAHEALVKVTEGFLMQFADFERWPQGKGYSMSAESLAVFIQARAALRAP